jgi:excisionase family DNA binding protein
MGDHEQNQHRQYSGSQPHDDLPITARVTNLPRAKPNGVALRRPDGLPHFLTAYEAADLLRVSRKAVYVMVERGTLPGVIRRSRRRIVVDTEVLLQFLRQPVTSSPHGGVR